EPAVDNRTRQARDTTGPHPPQPIERARNDGRRFQSAGRRARRLSRYRDPTDATPARRPSRQPLLLGGRPARRAPDPALCGMRAAAASTDPDVSELPLARGRRGEGQRPRNGLQLLQAARAPAARLRSGLRRGARRARRGHAPGDQPHRDRPRGRSHRPSGHCRVRRRRSGPDATHVPTAFGLTPMDPTWLSNRTAIAGIGATEFSKDSGRSEMQLAVEAIHAALGDAGLAPEDVDGFVSYTVDGNAETEIARNLGIPSLTFFSRIGFGGGAPRAVIQQAAMAVAAGVARTVVVYRALNERSGNRFGAGVHDKRKGVSAGP